MPLEHASEFGLSDVSDFLTAPARRSSFPREQRYPRRVYAASLRTAEGHGSYDNRVKFATGAETCGDDCPFWVFLDLRDFHRPGDFFHAFLESPQRVWKVHTVAEAAVSQDIQWISHRSEHVHTFLPQTEYTTRCASVFTRRQLEWTILVHP